MAAFLDKVLTFFFIKKVSIPKDCNPGRLPEGHGRFSRTSSRQAFYKFDAFWVVVGRQEGSWSSVPGHVAEARHKGLRKANEKTQEVTKGRFCTFW